MFRIKIMQSVFEHKLVNSLMISQSCKAYCVWKLPLLKPDSQTDDDAVLPNGRWWVKFKTFHCSLHRSFRILVPKFNKAISQISNVMNSRTASLCHWNDRCNDETILINSRFSQIDDLAPNDACQLSRMLSGCLLALGSTFWQSISITWIRLDNQFHFRWRFTVKSRRAN